MIQDLGGLQSRLQEVRSLGTWVRRAPWLVAGGALGAVASNLLTDEEPGTVFGSDQQTFRILTLAGATYGVVRWLGSRDRLMQSNVDIRPALLWNGSPGVIFGLSF